MVDSSSVQERFARVMARSPDAIAVSSPAEAVTYAELDERANRIAHRLLGLGVRPEDPGMVLQERSVEIRLGQAQLLALIEADAAPQREEQGHQQAAERRVGRQSLVAARIPAAEIEAIPT